MLRNLVRYLCLLSLGLSGVAMAGGTICAKGTVQEFGYPSQLSPSTGVEALLEYHKAHTSRDRRWIAFRHDSKDEPALQYVAKRELMQLAFSLDMPIIFSVASNVKCGDATNPPSAKDVEIILCNHPLRCPVINPDLPVD